MKAKQTFSDKAKAIHFQLTKRSFLDEGKCLHLETRMYKEKNENWQTDACKYEITLPILSDNDNHVLWQL